MPDSKQQLTYTPELQRALVCFGDSITKAYTNGELVSETYPAVVSRMLNAAGCACYARNWGVAGETSAQVLALIPGFLQQYRLGPRRAGLIFEIPDVVTLMIGVNDGGGFTTSQSNIEQIIRAIRNGVGGVVAGQANLPAIAAGGQYPFVPNVTRFLVQSDTSTTGGFNIGTPSPPTITGTLAGSPPAIWVYRNAQTGEKGWSRVADNTNPAVGCQKILVLSVHWLNFTNGLGDTLALDYATYAPLRVAQLAAANAQGCPFLDIHAWQRSLVSSAVVGDSSGATAAWQNNQHPNQLAHEQFATAIFEALGGDNTYITSTVKMPNGGWLSSLTVSQ